MGVLLKTNILGECYNKNVKSIFHSNLLIELGKQCEFPKMNIKFLSELKDIIEIAIIREG